MFEERRKEAPEESRVASFRHLSGLVGVPPLYRAGITVTKTSAAGEQHQRLLATIGAPIPERHTARGVKNPAQALHTG